MLDLVYKIFWLTFSQLATVLGFFFVVGFVLARIQHATQRIYQKSVGWYGILWTAWIGTPVHELSHLIVAKLFAHRIEEVNFFRPNRATGALGHVDHSYNPRNLYQSIGNFFIGSAPMIAGCLVLALLFHFLLPNSQEILQAVQKINPSTPVAALTGLVDIIISLFSPANLRNPRFWIFVYL